MWAVKTAREVGYGVRVRVPSYIFLSPSFFFPSLSDFAPHSIIWTPTWRYHCENEKARKKKKAQCFCAVQFYTSYIISAVHHTTPKMYTLITDNVPRAPAMNPKIRAFSARLTRFAFLNITWAANIWSLWKRKENEKTLFPVHSHKKTWFAVIFLQFATVSPGIHESQTRISES